MVNGLLGITGYIAYYSLTGNRKRQAGESVDVPGYSAYKRIWLMVLSISLQLWH